MEQKDYFLVNKGFKYINPTVCGYQRCSPRHTFGPAVRRYWLIHYVMDGCGTFKENGVVHRIKKGECFVIKPHQLTVYSADAVNPWHYVWVGFYSKIDPPGAIAEQPVFNAEKCGGLFASLVNLDGIEEGREEYLAGRIMELFSLMSCGEPGISKSRSLALTAKDYIESEYMKDIRVEKIAGMLHVHRSYLSRIFKEQTGVSPKQYINGYRLGQAAELMREHSLSPGQAAASTGYADVFAFSRMFKRHFGMSPSAFKKQHKDVIKVNIKEEYGE